MLHPLPVYRRWFHDLALPLSIERHADAWKEWAEARRATLVGEEDVLRWELDQNAGELALITATTRTVFRARIAGTHDGSTWMWSWGNPSIAPAMQVAEAQVRAALEPVVGLTVEQLSISLLDGLALAAAVGKAEGAVGVYVARSGGATVYCLAVEELRSEVADAAEESEPTSVLDLISQLAAGPSPDFPDALHRSVQLLANQGHKALIDGHLTPASAMFTAAWARLESQPSPWEAPPAGWLQAAMGEALYLSGRYAECADRLAMALRQRPNGLPRPRTLARLAQARLQLGDDRRAADVLLELYVTGYAPLFDDLPEKRALEDTLRTVQAERDDVLARLSPPAVPGAPAGAVAVVLALTRALDALNTFAYEGSQEAEKQRTESHVLCEADEMLREEVNARWCRLLAAWCTTGKPGGLGSWGSDNPHAPEREVVLRGEADAGGRIVLWTKSTGEHGAESQHAYTLIGRDGGFWVEEAQLVFDPGTPQESRYSIF